ncbi:MULTISPECIES: hypothetical protein [Mesorhizobium]|uniref:Uncharacterized protein n=1 Tax=Mesorhizobium abyssinicae TaxID=1209958 RepID=A0ABU5AKJ2_9HYPH|nr:MULTISPECIES: hypothetical protein [Mesorhizobium]MDX8537769.1 hypothetical protein [Mesorhizobium abyssinicae]
MQILIRPSHLAPVEFGGVEQIEVDPFERAVPSGAVRRPSPFVVLQKPLAPGIAMVVEGDHAVRHIDMISRKAFAWNDPLAVKSALGRMTEESARKDVAGAVAKENAVRQRPEFFGVFLDAVLQDIHQVGASSASGTVMSGHCPWL